MYLLAKALGSVVKRGRLTVIEHDGSRHAFGVADPDRPPVTIRLADRRAAFDIVRDPRLGAGEAYMNGRLEMVDGDIFDLVDLFRSNGRWEDGKPGGSRVKRAKGWMARHWRSLNWERRSKANVAHHYDLSATLYDLFLDADRQYSCAYYTDPANTLEQAQADKKAHIAAKLHLAPGQRVLDIGCGWGGLALYLHARTGVEVLGITLSEEQLTVARGRAEAAGVADQVRFELADYRDVSGSFDRIVSVGMFEHVGPPHYRTFFRKCRSLLAPDGVMLIHTIGRFGGPGATDAFTRKYIFPGGYIPALSELVAASEQSRLLVSDVETLRLHYGHTTRAWYDRVTANREAIEALYDARFFRMWQFYLAGAASAFFHGGMGNYQVQYIRDRRALPITRDYIGEAESRWRAS